MNRLSFSRKRSFVHLLVLLITNSMITVNVNGLSLNATGYYDIVVAVSEKTAQNEIEKYIENLKTGLQDLSDALYEATNKTFVIRSADILLPDHWHTEADTHATTQAFETADIRISHEYDVPQAINPVFCAYPGNYIQLPYSFFNEPDTGPYGPTGKALLTLWARFRWGIHEEHGYPGDDQLPYFWKAMRLPTDPPDLPETWRVTSCTNTELQGKYENLDGEECGTDPEDKDGLYPPPSDCRFHPYPHNQTATSSLMSFQFIDSLTHFCDEDTHDKRAPTRQNQFCQWKSSWEVIRESPDWKSLDEGSKTERTRIKFRIVKSVSTKPLLFVLTEGVNKPSPEIVSFISSGLREIFDTNSTKNWNVLASLGVFPGEDKKDSYDTLYDLNYPWYESTHFVSLFETSFGSRSGFRNFGAAIQDIGNRIKDMRHKQGAIILVIKNGSETNSDFQKYFQAFESEVTATILEQNIRLFALEGSDTQGERLKDLTEFTQGLYFKIGDDVEEDEKNIASVFQAIEDILEAGTIPRSRYRLAFKEVLVIPSFDSAKSMIPVVHGDVARTLFHFHSLTGDIATPTISKGPGTKLPTFQQVPNWGKTDAKYQSYLAESDDPFPTGTEWEYSVTCNSWMGDCFSLMVVIVELNEAVDLENEFSLSVSTTAEISSMVDLNTESVASLKGSSFSVFAKVEKNGHPVNSPNLEVKAHIIMFRQDAFDLDSSGNGAFVVELKDDGKMSPDMTANDGIFSGSYIPLSFPNGDNGIYQIFVTATLRAGNDGGDINLKSPLPIKQESIRCGSGYSGCWSETVTEPFMAHSDLKRRIEFRGSLLHISKTIPFRVNDLKVFPKPDSPNAYKLSWTEPIMITDGGIRQANGYEVYGTENFYQIVEGGNQLGLLPDTPNPVTAGNTLTMDIGFVAPGSKFYYVMRSKGPISNGDSLRGDWSNIAFLHAKDPYVEVTTTTTTTTTPGPTTSTTRLPSLPSTLSTAPSLSTTTPTTTTRAPTTTERKTRRTSTTVTETTTPKSTTPYIVVTTPKQHWYTSTEAIVTFSVFGVLSVGVIGGILTYLRLVNRG